MIWGRFEEEKEYFERQSKVNNWDKSTGMELEDLQESCNRTCVQQEVPRIVQRGKLIAEILTSSQLEINPYDWYQDKINHGEILANIEKKWLSEALAAADEQIRSLQMVSAKCSAYTGDPDFGHCIPDWERILFYGFPGLKGLAEQRLLHCINKEQREFYISCILVVDGMINLTQRLADAAKKVGEKFEKQRLVAQSLHRLALRAPENILEAMQLIILYYEMQTFVEGTFVRSLGSLDRVLYKFYVNDLHTGTFTKEQIKELLDYFLYKLMAKSVIANMPICIGAADENFAPNELTYIFLEEYRKLKICDPKIHIRCNSFTPDGLLREVCESIRRGYNSYVFMNDDVISKAFRNMGRTETESKNYAVVGCYEPCINGKEVPCSCNGRINLLKALELALNNGANMENGENIGLPTGLPFEIKSFDEFYEAVQKQLAYFANCAMKLIANIEKYYPQIHTAPLLSMSFASCMERGVDAYAGGAEYNNSSVNVFGIANIVDSLQVIKHLIFEKGEMTLSEFAEILRNNWNGREKLRIRCKREFPKYGNGDPEADTMASDIISYMSCLINGKPNGRGGVFRLGVFSIDWRIFFGEGTWATPDGRMAGEQLSKNIDAAVGQDRKGVTGLIRSATRLDFSGIPNGSVLDITLHNTAVSGEEGLNAMLGIIKTFMKRGGMAIQFNVLDEVTLKEAQKHPEKYKNLQVRLCGWNVCYINLSEKEQNDFIEQLKENR